MPGARDEADAEPLDVVERIVERVDLELAAVAGAGVDVADAERAAEHRRGCDPAGRRECAAARPPAARAR